MINLTTHYLFGKNQIKFKELNKKMGLKLRSWYKKG